MVVDLFNHCKNLPESVKSVNTIERFKCIPANQSDFVVFVPIFSSKKGEKSEQYDFYVGRRRKKKISGARAEYYRYSFPTVKANTRHLF